MQPMKTILVPTDYSASAENAVNYAIELANNIGAKIVLLHVYHPPIPTGEAPVILVTPEDLQKVNLKKLAELQTEVSFQLRGKAGVTSLIRSGFTHEEISDVAKEIKADLILMGITGGGKIAKALIGSTAVHILRQSQTPVLTIPHDCTFRSVNKLVLAYDCKIPLDDKILNPLKEVLKLFGAELLIIDVVDANRIPSAEVDAAAVMLEAALSDVEYELIVPQSDDVAHTINTAAELHKADWLVMIPHKHNFFQSLFHKSNTKEVAFHTHLPLFTIHE